MKCFSQVSNSCGVEHQLTPVGWVNVTGNDTSDYCNGGCSDHTLIVLQCLEDVMRGEFVFESKQTVQDINYTITQGCLKGTCTVYTSLLCALLVLVSYGTSKFYENKNIRKIIFYRISWFFLFFSKHKRK